MTSLQAVVSSTNKWCLWTDKRLYPMHLVLDCYKSNVPEKREIMAILFCLFAAEPDIMGGNIARSIKEMQWE